MWSCWCMVTNKIKKLEHLSSEERLRDLGWLILEKRKFVEGEGRGEWGIFLIEISEARV